MSGRSASTPPLGERQAWIPSKPVGLDSRGVPSGTHASTHASSAQTRPDLPAVRTTTGRVSIPSWVDESEFDRDTEISELLEPSAISSKKAHAKDQSILVRLDGVDAGQVSSIDGSPLSIGRHPTNRLRIGDVGISRFHARVFQQGGESWVEDLGSQNGTFLVREGASDKIKLTALTQLENGDVLYLGRRVGLRFARVDAEQVALMRQLFESSTRDALTGAHNRKHFDDRLNSELAYALRHNTSVALIMIDIDHFKRINDRHGHAVGDLVLRQTARAVAQRLRTEDMFARFGGEEFAVILRGVNLAGAARLGERLRATVAALPTQHEGTPIPVTISLGCATLSCCKQKTETALLEAADRRLYRAKHTGRNRVVSED